MGEIAVPQPTNSHFPSAKDPLQKVDIEPIRQYLQAEIDRVVAEEGQFGLEVENQKNNDQVGFVTENRILEALNNNNVFPFVAQAPKSLDEPNGSSKADLIILLPSGKPIGVQLFASNTVMDGKGVESLITKSKPTVEHQINALKYVTKKGTGNVFERYPMPMIFVAVDSRKALGDDKQVILEFLSNLVQGISPNSRQRLLEYWSKYYKDVKEDCQKGVYNLSKLKPYLEEIAKINYEQTLVLARR